MSERRTTHPRRVARQERAAARDAARAAMTPEEHLRKNFKTLVRHNGKIAHNA